MNQPLASFTLGYFTAALPQRPLERQVEWASAQGFEALELAAWPMGRAREARAAGHLDVRRLSTKRAEAIRGFFERHHLRISALGYYDNCLHPSPAARKRIVSHLKKGIEAAAALGANYVGTFIGRHPGLSESDNLGQVPQVFDPLVDFATRHGVRLMVENCPMVGWQREGLVGNLAYRPGIWDMLFQRYEHLGLNFDPSHLIWQGMNALEIFSKFTDRIYHIHAKDTLVDQAHLREEGYLSPHWWEYRLPGRGEFSWKEFFRALVEGGYTGAVSIEHEDPEWCGSEAKVLEGLAITCREMRRWREIANSECIASCEE